jgi:integration host factor subunit beta
MRKSDLIEKLAQRFSNISISNIKLHVNAILTTVRETLGEQQRIEIRDFGSFSLRYRAAYRAHNPYSGNYITTSAKHRPHFKPGKKLKERVNKT